MELQVTKLILPTKSFEPDTFRMQAKRCTAARIGYVLGLRLCQMPYYNVHARLYRTYALQ